MLRKSCAIDTLEVRWCMGTHGFFARSKIVNCAPSSRNAGGAAPATKLGEGAIRTTRVHHTRWKHGFDVNDPEVSVSVVQLMRSISLELTFLICQIKDSEL